MQIPVQPENEVQRLAHLKALKILDTAPEERLDNITQLAAAIFAKPVSLISLVDEDRQWFKARCGMELQQTDREVSICAHVVAENTSLIVEDTLKDPRFADNPLVQDEYKPIRFYAGAPITTSEGYVLGSLCVIDHVPGSFSEDQLAQLKRLARVVEDEIQLRQLFEQTKQAERKLVAKSKLLEERNKKLLDLIERFKSTRSRLISSEKLATLGLLAAGVGQEANRAINLSRKHLLTALDFADNSKSTGLIGQSMEAIDELRRMVDALCDTTETAGNNEWASTDLNETVKHCRNVVLSRYADKIRFVFEENSNVPLIKLVESQIFMALLNILLNAAESTKGRVTVKAELKVKADHVQIRIADNGNGMTKDECEQACEPFFSRGKDDTHFGLGLSIAQGIVRDHGGAIRLQSEQGKGSRVIIALPLERRS